MGNAILRCFEGDNKHDYDHHHYYYPPPPSRYSFQPPQVPHSDTDTDTDIESEPEPEPDAGLINLTIHLINFQTDHLVPRGLNEHLALSNKTLATWYAKILPAWKESPPTTVEEVSSLVARVLQLPQHELAGFLEYYGLPFPEIETQESDHSSWPEGVQFELHTLPVAARLVGDGDGMTVHVSAADPRESALVPVEIQEAAIERCQAQAVRDYARADALLDYIKQNKYKILDGDILAREYRIRLRGIDAPEMNQEYGQEAKTALMKLIQDKHLKIYVYESDKYDRLVGDVHCNGVFIQEELLKNGCAWHYETFDKRPEFAQWQREARNAGRGLWANPNPVAPWDHKRKERNWKNGQRMCQNRRPRRGQAAEPIQVY